MKEELKEVITFAIGTAVGGGLSYLFTRAYYQKKYKKQIDDISHALTKIKEEKEVEINPVVEKEDKQQYQQMLDNLTAAAKESAEISRKLQEVKEKIREVDHEEFLNLDYDIKYLNYYEDGIITDDRDVIIERPESQLGAFYEDFFADKLEGIVHIANDIIKEKYSIAICNQPFMDDISDGSEVGIYPTDDDDDEEEY